MKFVTLTDTHLIAPGHLLCGLDPAERRRAAARTINRDHPDIDTVIVTTD